MAARPASAFKRWAGDAIDSSRLMKSKAPGIPPASRPRPRTAPCAWFTPQALQTHSIAFAWFASPFMKLLTMLFVLHFALPIFAADPPQPIALTAVYLVMEG